MSVPSAFFGFGGSDFLGGGILRCACEVLAFFASTFGGVAGSFRPSFLLGVAGAFGVAVFVDALFASFLGAAGSGRTLPSVSVGGVAGSARP